MKKQDNLFHRELIKPGERMINNAISIAFFNRGKWLVFGELGVTLSSLQRVNFVCGRGESVGASHYVFPARLT